MNHQTVWLANPAAYQFNSKSTPDQPLCPLLGLLILNQSPLLQDSPQCDLFKLDRDLSYLSVTYLVLPAPYGPDAVHFTNLRSTRCVACWSGPPASVALDLHPECAATLRLCSAL
jgi:hypothetical protein